MKVRDERKGAKPSHLRQVEPGACFQFPNNTGIYMKTCTGYVNLETGSHYSNTNKTALIEVVSAEVVVS